MKEEIQKRLAQIEAAVNAVYIKGCDDIAMSNLAQLRGIWQSVQVIKELIKEDDTDA